MIRLLLPAGFVIAALAMSCSSGNKQGASPTLAGQATPNRAAASQQPATPVAQSTPLASPPPAAAAARTPPPATQAATVSPEQAQETQLAAEVLQPADVPPPLALVARQVYTNSDYASTQPNPVGFTQVLNQAGRQTGFLVEYLNPGTVTPAPNMPDVVAVLDILSVWKDAAAAQAGLAQTLNLVSQSTSQPGAATSATSTVDLGTIGDEVHATRIHVTSVIPGQLNSDAYIIGLRKGANTAIVIFTGQNGAPTGDQVKQLAQAQANRLP